MSYGWIEEARVDVEEDGNMGGGRGITLGMGAAGERVSEDPGGDGGP